MASRARASRSGEPRQRPATTEEVADFLRKKPHTLENWRSEGKGPRWHRLGGGGVVYDWPDVYEWYDAQISGASPQAGAA